LGAVHQDVCPPPLVSIRNDAWWSRCSPEPGYTLATQSINNGMSLEAVSAKLGHRSMRMTLVYARIADRTIADEYFTAANKVDQLYTTHLTTSPA
jgi:hypothetical protein